jgi:hypothetical protein
MPWRWPKFLPEPWCSLTPTSSSITFRRIPSCSAVAKGSWNDVQQGNSANRDADFGRVPELTRYALARIGVHFPEIHAMPPKGGAANGVQIRT